MRKDDRTRSWVTSTQHYFPPSPPPDESAREPVTLKRKRTMSHRIDSPKRQRTEPEHFEELSPEQSASQLSSSTSFPLHENTTFSPQSRLSSKRSSSPTRETPTILRSAWPPVVVESLNGLKVAPPTHVERLGEKLADGVDSRFIPKGLEVRGSVWFWLVRYLYCSSESSRAIPT